ncbi:bifunctional ADP-dependent NAD(P)H-hydrate dehydratase/NAD(P)H-hydrate epimerase [Specibacter cremeus]|uniref:bifunctional ADP-dependent NAD(P)H-hydrate dehydratase/NAD(P)H-hydrate epimerase n=1 Tax=Specibacter cremeus TaxID=1629051 RepID=UPI000F76EAFE|nr:bifunctional ADP-dependent NAD(P)H-hydrate dehydratase/NAD(P)H-hydrate epimerase [Specibacter cremeus]
MLRAHTGAAVRAAEQPLLDAGAGPALMHTAAHGLRTAVVRVLRERGAPVYGSRVLVLAGAGNNGGDALYAAAGLARLGARTTAVLTSARTHPDALAAFRAAGGRVVELATGAADPGPVDAFVNEAARADVVIDGILGTGSTGAAREPAATVLRSMAGLLRDRHRAGRPVPSVVACDLPSGVDAGTGEVHEPVLPADRTVTFGAAKTGLFVAPGALAAGAVTTIDLGIGTHLGDPDVLRLTPADLAALLPRPAAADHKYARGVAGIVAGSAQYPGAALLAVAAASACGPGMVRYLGPGPVAALIQARNPEAVCADLPVAGHHVQAWLAGPGIDGDATQQRRARDVIDAGLPAVIDAAALDLLGRADAPRPHLVLTPHAGELAALLTRLGQPTRRADVERATLAAARRAVQLTGATVLLKGPVTLVASPTGTVFAQGDGTPSLATAGSGDTLAGILAALLAMVAEREGWGLPGVAAADRWALAAAVGAALHGRLGRVGPDAPLNAGQLAARIPDVWAGIVRRGGTGP